MSAYTHFTPIERGHMAALLKEGKTQAYIAAELGRSEATISREINRNSGREAHDPNQAQGNYENRRKACRRPHKLDDPELNARVKRLSVVGRRSRFSTACFTKTVDIPSVTQPSTAPFTRAVSITPTG